MTSHALTNWRSTRAARLDNLANAHRAMAGAGPGRKWLTTEINHALIVRLATEFQGFCRDLHDNSIEAILTTRLAGDPAMASLMRSLLEDKRRLDTGNAGWGNVCHDFTRLGIRLADELAARNPGSYTGWITTLTRLNTARNAIAHDDRIKLAECRAEQPLTISTFRAWRRTLTSIAAGLDEAVDAYLNELACSPKRQGVRS